MKKKFWFGEWHSTRKSCRNAYIKLRLDVVNNEFEDKDKKGLNGKVYVFQGNEKLMLDYVYDNYLTKNEGYLKIKNLDKKPEAWGIRNLCSGNYPLCFIPHNSTDNKFIDIKKRIPLKRVGEHQELANLVAYLLSDYSAYITGEVVTIDGAEWIHKAGEFNWLDKVPKKMWSLISKSTRKKK